MECLVLFVIMLHMFIVNIFVHDINKSARINWMGFYFYHKITELTYFCSRLDDNRLEVNA